MACNGVTPFFGLPLQNTASCTGASSVVFMTLVNTLLRNHPDVSDVCGRVIPKLQPDNEYDFIVVGGGGGGSVVAGRLSENPNWKVLLIEQGDDEPVGTQVPGLSSSFIGNSQTTLFYPTEPQTSACQQNENSQCTYVRAKMLGGCSAVNGMTYMRGVERDYDHWAELGNTGWSHKEVLPYFRKSEDNGNIGVFASSDYHGVGGPLSVERFPDAPEISYDILKAASANGFQISNDLNGKVNEGFTITQQMNKYGTRASTARVYLGPARNRPNLHVMLNSTATRIDFSDSNGPSVAKSVEFTYNGQRYNVKVNKEVIVSAGTIGSPQLLLLSGIGPKADLDGVNVAVVRDLPGVGQNFQNHVGLPLTFNLKKVLNTNLLTMDAVNQYLQYRKGPLASTGLSQVAARFTTSVNMDKNWPDMQIYFGGYNASCTYNCGGNNLPADPSKPNDTRKVLFQVTLVRPKSVGFIKLRSNDPGAKPVLQPNYLTNDYDVKAMISGIRSAIKVGTADNLKDKYGIELVVDGQYGKCSALHQVDSDDYWECAIRFATFPENHLAGSCKMGPQNDPLAVVSPQLKVYGTANVRVADASVFPSIPAGNTLATVVLAAEKAADFIKNDWAS